jgi:hypothetical protein
MKALKREDDAVTYAAIEFLNALMQVSSSELRIISLRVMKQLN